MVYAGASPTPLKLGVGCTIQAGGKAHKELSGREFKMGLLKDTWDILKDEPEIRKWLKDQTIEAYRVLQPKVLTKVFGRRPTRLDIVQQELKVFEAIRNREFAEKFVNRLTFLEFLLGHIVRAVESKERGVLLRNLYVPDHFVYFPISFKEKTLQKTHISSYYTYSEFITESSTFRHTCYRFYVIEGERMNEDTFPRIQTLLDNVTTRARTTDEVSEFKSELSKLQLSLEPVEKLYFFANDQVFAFASDILHAYDAKYVLSFEQPQASREAVWEDMQYLLNFVAI